MSGFPLGLDLADPIVTARLLLLIEALFALRVAGQALVARRRPAWLPSMSEWYSGLIPYPLLLAIQLAILAGMTVTAALVAVGMPTLAGRTRGLGTPLLVVAWPYAGAMVARYGIRMWRHPEARWTGQTIPILFHIVLASWLFVLGSYVRTLR